MTFADFAITETRFRKHFRMAPPDTWNENMVPLAEFLDLDEDEREGKFPFVWSVNRKQELSRLLVAKPMVESCEDRRDFWTHAAGAGGRGQARALARGDRRGRGARRGGQDRLGSDAAGRRTATPAARWPRWRRAAARGGAEEAPRRRAAATTWRPGSTPTSAPPATSAPTSTPDLRLQREQEGLIKDPRGGPYRDLVKAAERCTAQVIHPGLPRDRSAKDIDKWIKRGEKYN